jgi:hypothetical protein
MIASADAPVRNTSEKIEVLTRVGATGLGFLYLCGFLVVSIHLSRYGVYSIALLRGQYLAAGIFSLGPLCLTYFVAAMLHTSFKGFPVPTIPLSGWPWVRRTLSLLWKLAWGFFAVYVVSDMAIKAVVSVFVPSARDILWSHFFALSWLTLLSVGLTWAVVNVWGFATSLTVRELRQDIKRIPPIVVHTIFSVVILVGYLSVFARHLYSEIPFAIGGGKPQTVIYLAELVSVIGSAHPTQRALSRRGDLGKDAEGSLTGDWQANLPAKTSQRVAPARNARATNRV